MAKYYKATEDSRFVSKPDTADIMIMTAHLLNLIQRSKNIYSLTELCKEYTFDLINKVHNNQTVIIYDDTKKLELESLPFTSYPIIFEFANDAGEADAIAYYDKSTTGINADIVVCVQQYEEEENGKVTKYCDKWIQIEFPDENDSIIISDGKISVS